MHDVDSRGFVSMLSSASKDLNFEVGFLVKYARIPDGNWFKVRSARNT